MLSCERCEKPIEEGTLCEECQEEDKVQTPIVPPPPPIPPPPPPSVDSVPEKKGIQKPVVRPTARDRIPRISGMASVTVYAYAIGLRGYRFTTNPPPVATVAWQKQMSGVEAVQFLRGIKSRNRNSRLESRLLPVDEQ